MATGASRRPSPILVVALLVALAAGAAASLLVGTAIAPSAPPSHASDLIVPPWVVIGVLLGLLIVLAAPFLYQRLTGGSTAVPGRVVVTILVVILVATLFLVAFQLLTGSSVSPSGATQGPPSSGNSSGPPGGSGANVTNLSRVGAPTSLTIPGLPGWLPFALVAGFLLLVAVFAIPAVRAWVEDRRLSRLSYPPAPGERRELRVTLERAEESLERGGDPREVVLRLYGELLGRLGNVVGDLGPETPEEIRELHLVRLGIRAEPANELTRLFEEARYSSHPLGDEAAGRARSAVRSALVDLDRTSEASAR